MGLATYRGLGEWASPGCWDYYLPSYVPTLGAFSLG